jgi:DNA invertase Pin-like site-specific DNA recombinase
MARIGYARVSTRAQNDDSQVDELIAAGCDPDHLFVDHGVSGKLAKRPELDKCLEYLRPGDVLVITRLSRAMRSMHHLLDLVNGVMGNDGKRHGGLAQRNVGLIVIKQGIDTTTPQGRLTFHILAAIDEFQRELIVEGTQEGLAAARARGRVGGRKPKLTPAQEAKAVEMYDAKGPDGKRFYTVADIAAKLRCSRPTVYGAIERQRAKEAKPA